MVSYQDPSYTSSTVPALAAQKAEEQKAEESAKRSEALVYVHFLAHKSDKHSTLHRLFTRLENAAANSSVRIQQCIYAELNTAASTNTQELTIATNAYLKNLSTGHHSRNFQSEQSEQSEDTPIIQVHIVLILSHTLQQSSEDLPAYISRLKSNQMWQKSKSHLTTMLFATDVPSLQHLYNVGADDIVEQEESLSQTLWKIYKATKIGLLLSALTNAQQHIAHLHQLSMYDELTGLYNMRYFHQCLQKHLSEATRYETHLALIMLDIDHFKKVNDKISHLAGSHILKLMGTLIAKNIRYHDTAARFGGDEFIIILTHTKAQGAKAVSLRLMQAIGCEKFLVENHEVHISVSTGVALYTSSTPQNKHPLSHDTSSRKRFSQELIKRADHYLYQAKNHGRARLSLEGKILRLKDPQNQYFPLTYVK